MLYGSPGVGNLLHIITELFNLKAGIKLEHVPYRGASEVINALLQGSIQVAFLTPATTVALIQEGKLRAIGFNGSKPFPELPNVPLVSASVPSISAVEHVGHLLRAGEDAGRDRRQAQWRDPARPESAGGRQCGGEIGLHSRRADRRRRRRNSSARKSRTAGEAVKAAGIEPN